MKEVMHNCYLDKIVDPTELEDHVAMLRKQSKTIVTLNGSFDLLHAGHLYILHEASLQADCLIVALNSDSSIKKYKSPLRPIIALEHRLRMIAALQFVQYVTWFDETDPCIFLEKVCPDVHVNGAEYGENCIEAEVIRKNNGRLHLAQRQDGLATSQIIETIKRLCV